MLSFRAFLEDIELQYHEELNSKLFRKNGLLRPSIRSKMLKYAELFRLYCIIQPADVIDILFTGGNANYNYTDKSDIDIHLVIDRSKLGSPAFVDDYLQDKKKLFSLSRKIMIAGYNLEPYAQDISERYPVNQGVYSVRHNKWVQQPENLHLNFSEDSRIEKKVNFFKDLIDHIVNENLGRDEVKVLRTKIKDMRGASIKADGEFALGNLVFKELRNEGYLDKLNDYEDQLDLADNYGV